MAVPTKSMMERETASVGAQIPFESIHEPGTFVCNWSGHLLRIPEDAVIQGRSPMVEILGREPLFATKISNDPYMTLTKARLAAADHDVLVNF